MSRRVAVLPRARLDLLEQADYLARDGGPAGERLYEAADATFMLLSRMPEMGVLRDFGNPILAGLRMVPVCDFDKHLVFYRIADDRVEILRVLHSSRDLAALFRDPEQG